MPNSGVCLKIKNMHLYHNFIQANDIRGVKIIQTCGLLSPFDTTSVTPLKRTDVQINKTIA